MGEKSGDVTPAHEPHGDEIGWNRLVGQQIEDLEEQPATDPLDQAATPRVLHAIDDIGMRLTHAVHEKRQQLWLLLEIRVDQEDQLAARMREPGHHRLVMPEVPRQVDNPEPGVDGQQLQRDVKRFVRRPVVDENHFIVVARRRGSPADPGVKLLQVWRRPIQCRDD